jgi:hypothetical protein
LQFHSHRRAGLAPGQNDENGKMSNQQLQGYRSLLRELVRDERKTAIRLGNEGRISVEGQHKIERELDKRNPVGVKLARSMHALQSLARWGWRKVRTCDILGRKEIAKTS